MKLSVLQQDLLPALQSASRCVGIRSSLPVLDNILLSLEDQKLKIAATNLEIGLIKFTPVTATTQGEITVPAKVLMELISGLGPSKIELESQGEILTIQAGKLKATINGIAASEFPVIPLASSKGITFPKEVLLNCSQILFAAAVDEGRPVLTGILTEFGEDKVDFVATDGFRLAHRQISLSKKSQVFKSLIPKRTFEEVLRVIAEDEADEVTVSPSQNQNQIVFNTPQTIISSRLIEGQFPAWEKIIPQKIETRVVLDKEELLRALRVAAVFAKNETNAVVLTADKDKLSLTSSAKEVGGQENEIEAQIEGDKIQVAFNTKFLQDAVSSSPASQLILEFSGPLKPALLKPVGVEGLEYIVMPVRLS